jgi:hypothetical protein
MTKCDLKTETVRGTQNCRKPAVFLDVEAYGTKMNLCLRHHDGLSCRNHAVACHCRRVEVK